MSLYRESRFSCHVGLFYREWKKRSLSNRRHTSSIIVQSIGVLAMLVLGVQPLRWIGMSPQVIFGSMRGTLATPTDSPGSGSYSSSQTMTLSCVSGSTCYYTNDGVTVPNCTGTGTLYSGGVTTSSTTTYKSIACKNHWRASGVLTSTYTITSSSCGSGFTHCRSITWDHTQAGTADTPTFPGLLIATWANAAVTGSSGVVTHTGNQTGGSYNSTIPYDFIFATDITCATPVTAWEFESYTSTSGAFIAWINIGTLSHSVNTSIYACYGKSSITSQQNTVNSTWDSNFKAVHHYAGSLGLTDSTSNGNTLTKNNTPVSGTGQIGNGVVFNGANNLFRSSVSLGANAVTVEAWVFSATLASATAMLVEKDPVNAMFEIILNSGVPTLRGGASSPAVTGAAGVNSTWTYLAATISGTSGVIYTNGSAASGSVTAFTDSSTQITIGAYGGGSLQFNGSEDEVRYSNTARSSSYVTSRTNQEKTGQTMVTVGSEN